MQSTGYLAKRQRHPLFLATAVALNLGAVGAMLASGTLVVIDEEGAIPIIKIARPEPVKIEPVKPLPRPNDDPKPRQRVDAPVPPMPVPQFPTAPWVEGPPLPPLPPLPPVGGTGEGAAPPLKPVEVAARFDPRFAAQVQPPYPDWLVREEVEGSVTVRVRIGVDGRVTAVELVSSTHPDFFPVTRDQALRKWRFTPATRDGVAVPSSVVKTVRFEVQRT